MNKINYLPFEVDLDDIEILKLLNIANYKIGELSGILNLLPNPNLILSLINIGESKDSSEIENIYTTYEDIFKVMVAKKDLSSSAKEVLNYKNAMDFGFLELASNGFISTNSLVSIQAKIEMNQPGIRRISGTRIINSRTGEVVHTPPQSETEIRELMSNLEKYINYDIEDYDPLIKMALIHYQFESIHPFYDGNGRTGRILNVLYLVLMKKIKYPILYLSKYIIQNKNKYYELLRKSNEDINNIREFVVYILKGIGETATYTVNLITQIDGLINITKIEMKARLKDIYRAEIVDYLFENLYTKNEHFRNSLGIARATATKYLKELEKEGFLTSERIGNEVIYKNIQLSNIFK